MPHRPYITRLIIFVLLLIPSTKPLLNGLTTAFSTASVMSRKRRNFSAKFKSDLVIELLKGEKDLNTLATENNIQPNLLRNWKREFLNNASAVFDDKREENLKEKLVEERKEKAEYAKKVGQLTMRVDWLKKNLKKFADLTTRVNLVRNLLTTKELPASVGASLLDINRTSIYYKGSSVSDDELACKVLFHSGKM